MGASLSTPEVAHAIGHHHGKTQSERHAERIEILEAVMRVRLGVIAVFGFLLAVALHYAISYPVA